MQNAKWRWFLSRGKSFLVSSAALEIVDSSILCQSVSMLQAIPNKGLKRNTGHVQVQHL